MSPEEAKPKPASQALLVYFHSKSSHSGLWKLQSADKETNALHHSLCCSPKLQNHTTGTASQKSTSLHDVLVFLFTHVRKQYRTALAEINIKIKIQLLLPLSIFHTVGNLKLPCTHVCIFSTHTKTSLAPTRSPDLSIPTDIQKQRKSWLI